MKVTVTFIIFLSFSGTILLADEHFIGRYAECSGTTDNGESVSGECYFYSNTYGDFSGTTDNGNSASGECWRWSDNYADLEGVTTDNGESVSGECYLP